MAEFEIVEIVDSNLNVRITLDGNTGDIIAGGNGQHGDIYIRDSAGNERIWIGGHGGNISVKNLSGEDNFHVDGKEGDIIVYRNIDGFLREVMKFDASNAALSIGDRGNDGNIFVRNNDGETTFIVNGNEGNIIVRNNEGEDTFIINGNEGDITVRRKKGGVLRNAMKFDASHAALYIGSQDNEGDIIVRNNAGDDTFIVNGDKGDIIVRRKIGGVQRNVLKFDASHAELYIGSLYNGGDIFVRNNAGDNTFIVNGDQGDITVRRKKGGVLRDVMEFDASHAALYIGSQDNEGDVIVRDNSGNNSIRLDGNTGSIILKSPTGQNRIRLDPDGNAWMGGNGADGDLRLFHCDGDNETLAQATIHLDGAQANAWLGGHGVDGDLFLFPSSATNINDSSQASIHLNGDEGDIKLMGADCAEKFDVADEVNSDPGTVMVIDSESNLSPCKKQYDKRVAGVVSGAQGHYPGIVLDNVKTDHSRRPVALNGKVFCKVDASYGAIEIGDLLTTSITPGHAQKATDPMKAFGSVIGKALRPLSEGSGLIPILVALQ